MLAAGACFWVMAVPRPDVLVAGDGQAAAIRGGDGRLSILHNSRDNFAVKEWLMADGDGREPTDTSLREGVRCDAVGCIGRLTGGRLASLVLSVEAFAEDCTRAAVVVSPREAPAACKAVLIDRKSWRANGAVALRWTGDRFELRAARPPDYQRPWAHPPETAASAPAPLRPATPDATPKVQDLEPDD